MTFTIPLKTCSSLFSHALHTHLHTMRAWYLKLPKNDNGSETASTSKASPENLIFCNEFPEPSWPPHEHYGFEKPCYKLRVTATSPTRGELNWTETTDMKKRIGQGPIPGHDVVGQVISCCTDPAKYKPGDFVYGLIDFDRNGAAAEFVIAYENEICKIDDLSVDVNTPKGYTCASTNGDQVTYLDSLAAIPTAGLTAYQALFDKGGLLRSPATNHGVQPLKVMITGASGAVGLLAVQLAHYARSAQSLHITAICSPNQTELLSHLGLDAVGISSEVNETVNQHGPFDLVLELTGGTVREMLLANHKLMPGDHHRLESALLTANGKVISITAPLSPAADKDHVNTSPGLTPRELQHLGDRFHFFIVRPNTAQLELLLKLIDGGQLLASCHHQIYSLENTVDAFRECEKRWRATMGKVIIHVSDP